MRFPRIFHRKRRSVPDTKSDNAADDKRARNFSKRINAIWDRPLSSSAWGRMKRGYQPESMDDRWVVSLVGEEKLVFARSWTGSPIVEIQVVAGDEARIVAIAWEGDGSRWTGGSEERAKELVAQLCASFFEVRLSSEDT